MKIAYKEFELRLKGDIGEIVCLDEYTKQENDCFMKIFFNITVAFFQLGVCYENEAELEKCYHAYKQAKWFGKTVKMNKASTFTDILFDIEERARIRSSLVDFFHKEEANVPDSPKREVKKNILVFNEEEMTWDCPCHGSRFDINGKVITGPAYKEISINNKEKD